MLASAADTGSVTAATLAAARTELLALAASTGKKLSLKVSPGSHPNGGAPG
jgi:hypothetical protein